MTERERKTVSIYVIRRNGGQYYKVVCRKGLLYEKIGRYNDFDIAYKAYLENVASYLNLPNIKLS